jgi:hypothetical protein
MLSRKHFTFCQELYVVEKSIDVVVDIRGSTETIRIEAHLDPDTGEYSTASHIQKHITVQPTYPQENGVYVSKPESIAVWAVYDLPWTNRATADLALEQALSFLRERCTK